MDKPSAGGFIALAGFIGAAVAVTYSMLVLSGEPYFRGPWIIGLIVGFMTMPALLIQELFPATWTIKYNWMAIIAGNSLWYSIIIAITCLVVPSIRKRKR